jgi:hypothetical protein
MLDILELRCAKLRRGRGSAEGEEKQGAGEACLVVVLAEVGRGRRKSKHRRHSGESEGADEHCSRAESEVVGVEEGVRAGVCDRKKRTGAELLFIAFPFRLNVQLTAPGGFTCNADAVKRSWTRESGEHRRVSGS